jgi:hypothetical protein
LEAKKKHTATRRKLIGKSITYRFADDPHYGEGEVVSVYYNDREERNETTLLKSTMKTPKKNNRNRKSEVNIHSVKRKKTCDMVLEESQALASGLNDDGMT